MKRIIIALLICIPFVLSAQEVRYLNENFNKAEQQFPPYGWRNIDHDGDGRAWAVSANGAVDATGAQTLSASSYVWLFDDLDPDNWLITPPLYIENASDELSYWVGSFEGRPHEGRVYLSTTSYAIEDFTILLDEVEFKGTYANETRIIPLGDYVGETIYIAFRHTKYPNTEGISLSLDNITGPQVKSFDYDLAVSSITGFTASTCDIGDKCITVAIDNLGSQPISNFKVYYQCQGLIDDEHGHEETSFSQLYSETVTQTINPGESLVFLTSNALPFSEYNTGTVAIRAFIDCSEDMYDLNDGTQTGFVKHELQTPPFETGFESGLSGWFISERIGGNAPFGTGSNPIMANSGDAYLTASVYSSSTPTNGEDAYLATPCFSFDDTKDYRVDFFYAFRKFPTLSGNNKKLNFKLIAGTDQQNLLDDHIVLLETTLESTRPLVVPDTQAEYDLFSSEEFKMPSSGVWYLGLVIYSDEIVKEVKNEWMLFVDDLYLVDTDYERPIDLSLDKIIAPYNCNLSNEEPISFIVRNASLIPTSEITASYRINNGSWVTETFTEVIGSNEQRELSFSTLADLSSYRKYKIEGMISHEGEVELDNNENMIVTENKRVKDLPFVDGFEDYGTTMNFEDEYVLYGAGYYTWMPAMDYTGTQTYSYNGEGFLADAYDVEYYTAPDDWMVSCCFQFEKDKQYEVSFAYRAETYSSIPSELKVYLLDDYDNSAIIESLGHLQIQSPQYQIFKAYYTAQEDHIGHLALHSCGGLGASIIMMDDLTVKPYDGSSLENVNNTTSVTVYPNPASDYVNISTFEDTIKSVEIFDVLGRMYYSNQYKEAFHNIELSLPGYEKGNYIIQITLDSGKSVVKKIIIN